MAELGGVLNALATPFTADLEQVDVPRLRALVDHVIDSGAHGLVPCGSTGEFTAMTDAERRQVVEVVVEQAAGRVPVIAHTGALTARETISLSRHAVQVGADAIMAVAPFYEPLSTEEIKHFYRSVAESVPVDLVIYNIPVATGVNLLPDDLAALSASCPTIKYVKDTSGDFSQVSRLIREYAEVITTFNGLDTLFLATAAEGAGGVIVGAANFLPAELAEIWAAVADDRLSEARAAWRRVYPIMRFLTQGGYVAGVKGAMELLGDGINRPRRPYEELTGSRLEELKTIIKEFRP